jgi:phage-related protein
MARVIGEASVRLTVEGARLGASIKRAFAVAAREASAGGGLLPDLDKEADNSTRKVESRFAGLFGRLTNLGQGFASKLGSLLQGGAGIAILGAKAGVALAGITSLANGLFGLIGILENASGAAALLPAAFASFLAVSTTIKLATQGIGDSFKALASGDAQKFAESLKDLSPNAQQFVRSVAAIKPAFDQLQLATQDALFRNLGLTVRDLGAKYMPVLKFGFTGIAGELNTAAVGVGRFFQSSQTVSDVGTIFQNVQRTVAALAPSLTSVLSVLTDVGTVGSQFLPGLANGFSSVTDKFAQFVSNARESGALATFIQNGITTLKQLGEVAKNVFGIIGDLMNAGTTSGGGLLNNLIQITGAIRDFTSSAEGSKAINTFFVSMQQVISAVLPVVLALASVVGTTLVPIIANLASTIGPALLPVVQSLGVALQAAAPGIAALGQGFAALVQGIAPALPAVGQLAAVLGQGLGQVMATLGPIISKVAQVFADVLAKAIPPLVPVIGQLATLFGDVLTAVAPLLPPLVQLAAAVLQPLIGIVQALVPPFTQLVQNVLTALQPIIPVIANAFSQLGAALAPLAGALGNAVVQIFSALLPVIGPLVGAIVAVVQAFLPLIPTVTTLIQILAPIIALIVQISATMIAFVANAITPVINVFGVLMEAVSGSMNVVLSVIAGVVGAVTAIFSGFLTAVTNVWGQVTGSISNAVNNVKNTVANGFNQAVSSVKNAFNNIVNAVSDGVNSAVSSVSGLAGRVIGAVSNFGSILFSAGADLLRGLINGIGSMISGVINKVVDVGRNILGSIKGALGISSPSKEMAKIGVFVGQGLIKGLEQITPSVSKAALALGDTVTTGVRLNLPDPNAITAVSSGGNQGSSTVLNQNNFMLPGTDVRQFSEQVLRRANTDLSSGSSTLSVSRQGVQVGVNDGFLAGVTV